MSIGEIDRPRVARDSVHRRQRGGVASRLRPVRAGRDLPHHAGSPMGEHADAWAAAGRPNLWGSVPEVVEMQSEAGAAGALHGALQAGALATTFTASQGLLLMLPNMFKIAGELTPAVIHVAARAIATHALSIFGDHSDVMAARTTGWTMLCASSVQEAHDFALVAHAATLRTRVPILHFFDGFRTSHEINRVELLDDADLRRPDRRRRHRRPQAAPACGRAHRCCAAPPRTPTCSSRPARPARRTTTPCPAWSPSVFDELAARTGRAYRLVDYEGHPEAERVLVMMGSGVGAAGEAVARMVADGERVGLLEVRLFRPFPTAELLAGAARPASGRSPCSTGPRSRARSANRSFQDVVTVLAEADRADLRR